MPSKVANKGRPLIRPSWTDLALTFSIGFTLILGACTDSATSENPPEVSDGAQGHVDSGAQNATHVKGEATRDGEGSAIAKTVTRNAYFGDLHVHTKNSFDAFIIGTRTTADDAYRFAKGGMIDNGAGQSIQLSGPPLDFYAVTDHGEYMGVVAAMADPANPISATDTAQAVFGASAGTRQDRRNAFIRVGTTVVTGDPIVEIYDRDFIDSAWAENVAAAQAHNDPGTFTTFAGYEFTAMELVGAIADDAGALNLHRNVIFKDSAPDRIFTTLDSPNPEDLWTWMNAERAQGRDVVAIPHNSNGSNGQMFDTVMTDGSALRGNYAINRLHNEPLVEISQIKGTSETHPILSPRDEWADHELYDLLIGIPIASEKKPGSFVRPALARGMELAETIGINPYAFGFIGSSDTHVSAPSLSEEDHFGKFPTDTTLSVRGSVPPEGNMEWRDSAQAEDMTAIVTASQYAAAGLAGVWADANTREDIFAAFTRKETFATSGPRIKVRLFAGTFPKTILESDSMLEAAYDQGVAMGGTLTGSVLKASGENKMQSPNFLIWAMKDPDSVDLQRLQVVKVWREEGVSNEAVIDVACSGGTVPNPTTNRCPDNRSGVDLSTCQPFADSGAVEFKTIWSDPNFDPAQDAAYYVRVLENPKCRWSTWDAIRNGTPPNPNMQAVLQDRAWSSPIWVKAQ